MVAEDFGRPAALVLARLLVACMVRRGGQSQFSDALDEQLANAKGRFERLHDDERMRRAFLRTLRVSPSDYRHRFKSEAAGCRIPSAVRRARRGEAMPPSPEAASPVRRMANATSQFATGLK